MAGHPGEVEHHRCFVSISSPFRLAFLAFCQGMGTRMHYGHPDFVDGFWARNRGGMSLSVRLKKEARSGSFGRNEMSSDQSVHPGCYVSYGGCYFTPVKPIYFIRPFTGVIPPFHLSKNVFGRSNRNWL